MDIPTLDDQLRDKAEQKSTVELVGFFDQFSKQVSAFCAPESELHLPLDSGVFIDRDEAEQPVGIRVPMKVAIAALLACAIREYSDKRHQFLVDEVVSKADEILASSDAVLAVADVAAIETLKK